MNCKEKLAVCEENLRDCEDKMRCIGQMRYEPTVNTSQLYKTVNLPERFEKSGEYTTQENILYGTPFFDNFNICSFVPRLRHPEGEIESNISDE